MPTQEMREALLSTAFDSFDNAEQDPEQHPLCALNLVKDKEPSEALKWALKKAHRTTPNVNLNTPSAL